MIVSSGGKTYDSANGSEHPHAATAPPAVNRDEPALGRWADDGGLPRPKTPRAASVPADQKPRWSVLSLRRLKELLLGSPEPAEGQAAPPLQQPPGPGISQVGLANDLEDLKSANAKAIDEFYRNAWEHT